MKVNNIEVSVTVYDEKGESYYHKYVDQDILQLKKRVINDSLYKPHNNPVLGSPLEKAVIKLHVEFLDGTTKDMNIPIHIRIEDQYGRLFRRMTEEEFKLLTIVNMVSMAIAAEEMIIKETIAKRELGNGKTKEN